MAFVFLVTAHAFYARHYLQEPKETFCPSCGNGPYPDRSDCYYCHRSLLNPAPWDKVIFHIVIVWGAFFLGTPLLHLACRFWKIDDRLGVVIVLLGAVFCIFYKFRMSDKSVIKIKHDK